MTPQANACWCSFLAQSNLPDCCLHPAIPKPGRVTRASHSASQGNKSIHTGDVCFQHCSCRYLTSKHNICFLHVRFQLIFLPSYMKRIFSPETKTKVRSELQTLFKQVNHERPRPYKFVPHLETMITANHKDSLNL